MFYCLIKPEATFLEYWPSCIAAATILCAANHLPNFSLVNAEDAEAWCDGLSKVRKHICHFNLSKVGRLIYQLVRLRPSKPGQLHTILICVCHHFYR